MKTNFFGGAGNIGQIIVEKLRKTNQSVTVLTLRNKKSTKHLQF